MKLCYSMNLIESFVKPHKTEQIDFSLINLKQLTDADFKINTCIIRKSILNALTKSCFPYSNENNYMTTDEGYEIIELATRDIENWNNSFNSLISPISRRIKKVRIFSPTVIRYIDKITTSSDETFVQTVCG